MRSIALTTVTPTFSSGTVTSSSGSRTVRPKARSATSASSFSTITFSSASAAKRVASSSSTNFIALYAAIATSFVLRTSSDMRCTSPLERTSAKANSDLSVPTSLIGVAIVVWSMCSVRTPSPKRL